MKKKRSVVVEGDGDPCPRCGQPTQLREHVEVTAKHLAQPFYYRRWFNCTNRNCRTKLIMPNRYVVWNGKPKWDWLEKKKSGNSPECGSEAEPVVWGDTWDDVAPQQNEPPPWEDDPARNQSPPPRTETEHHLAPSKKKNGEYWNAKVEAKYPANLKRLSHLPLDKMRGLRGGKLGPANSGKHLSKAERKAVEQKLRAEGKI